MEPLRNWGSGLEHLGTPSQGAPRSSSRHFLLKEGDEANARVRFLSGFSASLENGKKSSWVTVTRTGTFFDKRYGEFSITREMLAGMVGNFNARTFGQDIFIDRAHQPADGAAGKIAKLTVEGDRLRALVEWTEFGVDLLTKRGFTYLSAEFTEDFVDNEQGKRHGPLLLGAGLVTRPCIKHLDPIQLAEAEDSPPTLLHPELASQLLQETHTMWKKLIEQMEAALKAKKLAEATVKQFADAAAKALEGVADETAAKKILAAFEEAGVKLAEAPPTAPVEIKVNIEGAAAKTLSEADVQKLIADHNAKTLADANAAQQKVAGKVKILTEAIAAAPGLDDAAKRELTDGVKDLVTAEMTDDHVKKLAESQIAAGNKIAAARKLSGLGYQRAGSPHIVLDDSNTVKKLQEEVDKRLGLTSMPDSRRYDRVGGAVPQVNKDVAAKVLAQFDALHGARLHEEAKRLAAGDSVVSDVAVPVSFERTVIREAMYNIVGLSLVNADTAPFAAVVQLPYSYRDTAAAGVSAVRKYEGQSILRAAVKQALHEARPIPQKLSFEVSDELRYLAGNGQINFDIVAENARNASRIIAEDTEQLIFDEHLNASDRFATTAVVNEAVANGDAAKTIFVLNNFPVVRPRKVFDLQGTQVGATQYAIAVTVGGAAKLEYDGTNAQAAGLYWKINYNLGELTFVSELGVPTAPANLAAIVASYTYTTNAVKWDSDLGALKVDEKYDDFLYTFGLRKEVIETDRHYAANIAIMSGTLRTQIERARQFSANYKRPGTDLTNEGNLGVIKGVPAFKSMAPGLAMGDVRCVIGERETVRLRMLKPWSMNQLENQKDANGRFTGKKEAYGDQFLIVDTPKPLEAALTSVVVYSAAARVDR